MAHDPRREGAAARPSFFRANTAKAAPLPHGELCFADNAGKFIGRIPFFGGLPFYQQHQRRLDSLQSVKNKLHRVHVSPRNGGPSVARFAFLVGYFAMAGAGPVTGLGPAGFASGFAPWEHLRARS